MKNIFFPSILNISRRQRIGIALLFLLFIAWGFYKITLIPYITYFQALRAELKAQRKLLAIKIERAQNLPGLSNEYQNLEKDLERISQTFFTPEEADIFVKQLPKVVSRFGSQLLYLKPKAEEKTESRVEKIKKFMANFHLPQEEKIINFLEENKKIINSESENMKKLQKIALKMLPDKLKDQFQTLWQEPQSELFTQLKLQKMNLETVVQGRFKEIIALFDWLEEYGKLIDLSSLQVHHLAGKAPEIEAKFTLGIYVQAKTSEVALITQEKPKKTSAYRDSFVFGESGPPEEKNYAGELIFEGFLEENGEHFAFINGQLVKIGDAIEGWKVLDISEGQVILLKGGRKRILPAEE